MPGVVDIITAADAPVNEYGLTMRDQPALVGVDHTGAAAVDAAVSRWEADQIAVVIAETRTAATAGAAAIEVEWEDLPLVDTIDAALAPGAPLVHPENRLDTNAYHHLRIRKGDPDFGFALAYAVVDEVYEVPHQEHAYLQPEAGTAYIDEEGRVTIEIGGQWTSEDREQVAHVLGLPEDRVRIIYKAIGGAFGGKEDMSNQGQTALAAWLLGRPVKTTFSREESFLVHTKRHPIRMEYEVGCDADGKLLAVKARMIGDSGPYASVGMKVLERAAGHASGPYVTETIDIDAVAVRTNNSVCGAFRGFGANQAQFAMEGMMDRLAEMAGISGWEIRSRNVVEPGVVWGPGQIMDDGCLGARACLDAVKPAWDAAVAAGNPVGMGLGLKNSGLGNGANEVSRSTVRFDPDGTIEVRHCWTEMGQGIHTVARQVAVEELGVEPDRIKVVVDTTRELGAGQTTGSRGTVMGAGSVADACRNAMAGGCVEGVEYEGVYVVDWTNSINDGLENPVIHSTFGYAAQLVELDQETGEIAKVVAAHDVGRAVNPLLCEGQIEGAVHMGLGYALTEGFPCDEHGKPLNETLRSLDIIRPKDMPPTEVILVESPDPNSPYGIKGVGEIGLVPTAGAVAAALHAHDGEWRHELPMRTERNRERASAWS